MYNNNGIDTWWLDVVADESKADVFATFRFASSSRTSPSRGHYGEISKKKQGSKLLWHFVLLAENVIPITREYYGIVTAVDVPRTMYHHLTLRTSRIRPVSTWWHKGKEAPRKSKKALRFFQMFQRISTTKAFAAHHRDYRPQLWN